MQKKSIEKEIVLRRLIEMGQFDAPFLETVFELFSLPFEGNETKRAVERLLEKLMRVDRFYREIGGIVGYQKKCSS